jgi:chromate reductase
MAEPMAPTQFRVLTICGSLRRESLNRKLMNAAVALAPRHFAISESVSIGDIPHLNDDVARSAQPASVRRFSEQIDAADAVVIVSPEYNYGIPGVMKNAIDWVGCPQPSPNPLRLKPVGLMGASIGNFGTMRCQLQMRQVLLFHEAYVMAKPEVYVFRAPERFDAQGKLTDSGTADLLGAFWTAIERFAAAVKDLRQPL